MVDGTIEVNPKSEVSETIWKMLDWVVEKIRELQVGEVGWEVVHWLVEVGSKRQVSQGMRKRRQKAVEFWG